MTTTLQISGMMCEACVGHVSRALQNIEGVRDVQVDLEAKRAIVEHDGASIDAMREAVEEEGYAVENAVAS